MFPDEHDDQNDIDTDAAFIREVQRQCLILEYVEVRAWGGGRLPDVRADPPAASCQVAARLPRAL